MALGPATFSDIGGAVSDLFAGLGAEAQGDLKAKGLNIQAQGQRIQAQSTLVKAQGDLAEGQEYGLAQSLAEANAAYTERSTAIQETQLDRQITMSLGSTRAAEGGAGLAASGSALDILRDSASQGALAKSVLQQQGQITEEGYHEQAQSYALMAATANRTAAAETDIAGQETQIAGETDQLAVDTKAAAAQAATGDFIAGAMKGVAAVATLFP